MCLDFHPFVFVALEMERERGRGGEVKEEKARPVKERKCMRNKEYI